MYDKITAGFSHEYNYYIFYLHDTEFGVKEFKMPIDYKFVDLLAAFIHIYEQERMNVAKNLALLAVSGPEAIKYLIEEMERIDSVYPAAQYSRYLNQFKKELQDLMPFI